MAIIRPVGAEKRGSAVKAAEAAEAAALAALKNKKTAIDAIKNDKGAGNANKDTTSALADSVVVLIDRA